MQPISPKGLFKRFVNHSLIVYPTNLGGICFYISAETFSIKSPRNFEKKVQNSTHVEIGAMQKLAESYDWKNHPENPKGALQTLKSKVEKAVQKCTHLVDFEKCCIMSMYLQKLASMEPRKGSDKFAV